MSSALGDLLIELSDPQKLETFRNAPEPMMTSANLTTADKAALRSGKSSWIRYQARVGVEQPHELVEHEKEFSAADVTVVEVEVDVIEIFTADELDSIVVQREMK